MANDVVRVIKVDEGIWAPTREEIAEKGNFLSVDDQRGTIQLDLMDKLERTDGEPIDHLLVRSPRQNQIQAFQSQSGSEAKREAQFYGGCCVGLKPDDVVNLHGRDWNRLTRLVTSFLV